MSPPGRAARYANLRRSPSPLAPAAGGGDGDGYDGGSEGGRVRVGRTTNAPVLYMTADLLARYSAAAGGGRRLETLRIDGLRRPDRLCTIEREVLATVAGTLLHLELPSHRIASMAPVLVCSALRTLNLSDNEITRLENLLQVAPLRPPPFPCEKLTFWRGLDSWGSWRRWTCLETG